MKSLLLVLAVVLVGCASEPDYYSRWRPDPSDSQNVIVEEGDISSLKVLAKKRDTQAKYSLGH